MRRLRLLLITLSWCVAGQAAADAPTSIVFLESAQPQLDDRALRDAVSIYTRDLGLTLASEGGAPVEITAASLGAVVTSVHASGRRGAFWYRVRSDGTVVLYAVTSRDHPSVHALRVAGPATPDLYRALALKLRAVLTNSLGAEPEEPTPPPAPPLPAAPPSPRPYRARVLLDAAYVLTVPLDAGLIRHGLLVDGALPLGRRWELHLAIEISSPAARTIAAGTASLFDVPLRLGARVFAGRGRLRVGLGPLITLHLLSASATGFDGTTGRRLDAAAGLGGELVGRARIGDHVAALFSFRAEEVLPDWHFTLHGRRALDGGGPIFTIAAGFELAAP